jgi:polysaccharide export outer membrane protein
MSRRSVALLWLSVVAFVLTACSGPRPGPPKNLPPAITRTTLGPGDKIEIEVVGEKDLPKEFTVESDGSIGFPYVPRLSVENLEPQQAAEKLKEMLTQQKILRNPQLTVRVKEYAGKKVIVSGQVQKPQSLPWRGKLGLVEAISDCGWFTPMADTNHVILTRQAADGRTVTVIISVEAITEGQQPDIPLQAGDRIKVQASVL